MPAQSPRAALQAEADWTDWELYDTGTFYNYPFAVVNFNFDPEETRVNVYRREDRNNEGYAQLKFEGMFGGISQDGTESYAPIDFIFDVDPDGVLTSQKQFTNIPSAYYPQYEFEYYAISPLTISDGFSPKRIFYLSFFLLVEDGLGFSIRYADIRYVSDKYVTPIYSLKWSKRDYSSTEQSGALSYELTQGVNKIRYYVSKTVRGQKVDDSFIYFYKDLCKKNCSLPYTEVTGSGVIEPQFTEGPGTYFVNLVLFDDDDFIISGYMFCSSNLPDSHIWEDVGQGWFAPVFLTEFMNNYYQGYEKQLVPELSLDGYEVPVQRAADAPHLVRVVNPFGAGSVFDGIDEVKITGELWPEPSTVFTIDHSEDYYLVIDTSDPENLYILDRPDGLNCPIGYNVYGNEDQYLQGTSFRSLVMRDNVYRDAFYTEFLLKMPEGGEPWIKIADIKHSVTTNSHSLYSNLSNSSYIKSYYIAMVSDSEVSDPELASKIVSDGLAYRTDLVNLSTDFMVPEKVTGTLSDHYNLAVVGLDWKGDVVATDIARVEPYLPENFTVESKTVYYCDPFFSGVFNEDIVWLETTYIDPEHPEAFMLKPFVSDNYKMNIGGALSYDEETGANPMIVSVDENNDAWMHTVLPGVYYGEDVLKFYDHEQPILKGVQSLNDDGGRTIRFDNFIVGILGYATRPLIITFPAESGVEDVATEAAPAGEAVYYDLQGRRVDNPSHGLYIEVRGTVARKVRM